MLIRGARLICSQLSFNFANPLLESTLDLRHSLTRAQMASLVEVLKISAQLLQELLGKSMAHRQLILHMSRGKCKITRFFCSLFGADLSPGSGPPS